jgi:hypothetical protein
VEQGKGKGFSIGLIPPLDPQSIRRKKEGEDVSIDHQTPRAAHEILKLAKMFA